MTREFQTREFVVFTDFPTIPHPEGERNSHNVVRQVRVCDCPKIVERGFVTREDAENFARDFNHTVVVPRVA